MAEFHHTRAPTTGATASMLQTSPWASLRPTSDEVIVSSAPQAFDGGRAAAPTARPGLLRKFKGRHHMGIAIGGSVGAGLWIGTGKILAFAGPGSLMLAYVVVSLVLCITMQALGELAATFPIAGSFAAYGTRFIDPAWGFAMGCNYAIQWLVVIPLEIVATLKTLRFWDLHISEPVMVSIFLASLLSINLCGIRKVGEPEVVATVIQAAAIVGFILLGIIVDLIGSQTSDFIGGQYWRDPGAFKNGTKGFYYALTTAAFAFTGTELVGLAAAETLNPTRAIPIAYTKVFCCIAFFHVISVTVVGLIVDSNDPRLLDGPSGKPGMSPFTVAIQGTGLKGLDSVMNAVILISVLSVANSSFFGSSRMLAALAEQRQAPAIFQYVDRKGRPLFAISAGAIFGLLSYFGTSSVGIEMLDWFGTLSGLSSLITWGSICLAHIRFRKAWKLRGYKTEDLVYQSPIGVVGSWIGLASVSAILMSQLYLAVDSHTIGTETTVVTWFGHFFKTLLAIPVILVIYVSFKLARKTRLVPIESIDIDTGRYRARGNR